MIGHGANWRGASNEAVLIVMPARSVKVGDETEFAGVTFPDQILPKDVCYVNLLVTSFEFVQVRVRVFLEHVESSEVVLPAIVVVVAKNSSTKVRVIEDESTKIADERLNPEARRNEIVVVR